MKRIILSVLFLTLFLSLEPLCAMSGKMSMHLLNIEWTLETTQGIQNFNNLVLSKESGTHNDNRTINYAGITFHSKINGFARSNLNLNIGMAQLPQFFWNTSAYDFDRTFNFNDVHCLEFDYQFLLPYLWDFYLDLQPFVGYSYIDYTYNDINGVGSRNQFNTVVFGVQNLKQWKKWLSTSLFMSYSPFLYSNYDDDFLRYLNYGGEVYFDTYYLTIRLLISFRKSFKKNRYYFDPERYEENTMFDLTEIGLVFIMRF